MESIASFIVDVEGKERPLVGFVDYERLVQDCKGHDSNVQLVARADLAAMTAKVEASCPCCEWSKRMD